MTTPPTYPPHLACLLCDPAPEFFTFYALTVHYYAEHPLVMCPDRCTCGHRESTHNPAKTRRYCQAGDASGPCPCRTYQRRVA